MDLSGVWRATPAREELRRTFHEPALDDRDWLAVDVPGHWSRLPALADEREVLHRCDFTLEPAEPDRRRWLRFDGIAQQGDVWLDGAYVGDTDGYFVPHEFEITDLLGEVDRHTLAVDVTVPRFGDPDERTNLMGAILDPELSGAAGANPGGIWRGVSIRETGLVAIRHFRVVCEEATPDSARLALRCVFDHPDGGPVVLRTRVADVEHEFHHTAAVGENRVEWLLDVPEPERWWPHHLGDQPLHDLTCELVADGAVHDSRSRRVAFRTVRMHNWQLWVNDIRVFAKGIALLPSTPRPGDASDREAAADVKAVHDAGLDLIRLTAHIAHPAVYDEADRLGLLIWQDMPIRGVMARGVKSQAVRQAREMVDLLGHHPSVAVWCTHDEPFRRPAPPTAQPSVLAQQRPSWNRAVLDTTLRRVIERCDRSRPVVLHTGVPPHLPRLDGTTSHLWFGWHEGRAADLAPAIARTPRMGRWVSAFGAATVDDTCPELLAPEWPALDWGPLADQVGAPVSSLLHLVDPTHVPDGPTWARDTETAQAELIRTSIEALRRIKYHPTAGFCLSSLADPSPAGGYGVLDADRRAKPAWRALIDACRPVIAVADPLPASIRTRRTVTAAVHVVNDLAAPLTDAVLTVTVTHPDGTTEVNHFGGDVGGDSVAAVTTVTMTPNGTGSLVLDLDLAATADGEHISASNRYRTTVG